MRSWTTIFQISLAEVHHLSSHLLIRQFDSRNCKNHPLVFVFVIQFLTLVVKTASSFQKTFALEIHCPNIQAVVKKLEAIRTRELEAALRQNQAN